MPGFEGGSCRCIPGSGKGGRWHAETPARSEICSEGRVLVINFALDWRWSCGRNPFRECLLILGHAKSRNPTAQSNASKEARAEDADRTHQHAPVGEKVDLHLHSAWAPASSDSSLARFVAKSASHTCKILIMLSPAPCDFECDSGAAGCCMNAPNLESSWSMDAPAL